MLNKLRAKPQTLESQITHAGQIIPLKIITSKRKTFSIAVYPNQDVIVKAPLRANINSLLSKVELKANWIVNQREKFKDSPAKLPPKKYQDGELFSFLGQQYLLKLVKSSHPKVEFDGNNLLVKTKTISPTSVKTTLKFWYQEQAKNLLSERLDFYSEQLAHLKLPIYSKLVIKQMKSRWGSCSRDRVIALNPELITAPLECIDYVIIHELCHLRELNHSPRYYKLLSTALPNWKELKARLNRANYSLPLHLSDFANL